MTKLTYKIVDAKNVVLERGIETIDAARAAAEKCGGKYVAEYTPIVERTHFDRSKCKISEEWLARHPQ